MDELYLDNIDEFVNDHNKIVSAALRLSSLDAIFVALIASYLRLIGVGLENS